MTNRHLIAGFLALAFLVGAGSGVSAEEAEPAQTGFTVIGGGGYMGIVEDDRPSMQPGAYLGSGPAMYVLAAYQGYSANEGIIWRLGGGYMGSSHDYRHESGGIWANRYNVFGDALFPIGAVRLGGRCGMGLGFGDLGDVYDEDNDNNRSLLGFYVELGLLLEVAVSDPFFVGVEFAGTVDGWTGEDPNDPNQNQDEKPPTTSLGGLSVLYAGYVF